MGLYRTVLHCTALHCTVRYGTATGPFSFNQSNKMPKLASTFKNNGGNQYSVRQHKQKVAGCRPERTLMEYPISVLEQITGC